jgi:hypothetical protein
MNERTNLNTPKIISTLSLVAGLLVTSMFLIVIFTGVSQEQFEITSPVESYTQNLVAAEHALRVTFAIDLVFIVVFVSLFVFLTQYLKTSDPISKVAANVALGAMLITGFLDFHEDLHILTMLRNATHEIALTQTEISQQMILSAIKFCASYLALFLLGFLLPARTFTEKLLKYSLLFVQLPIGALVYASHGHLNIAANIARFTFMAFGFFLLAYNFSREEVSEEVKS